MQGSGEAQRDGSIELIDDAEFFTDFLEPDELHLARQALDQGPTSMAGVAMSYATLSICASAKPRAMAPV